MQELSDPRIAAIIRHFEAWHGVAPELHEASTLLAAIDAAVTTTSKRYAIEATLTMRQRPVAIHDVTDRSRFRRLVDIIDATKEETQTMLDALNRRP